MPAARFEGPHQHQPVHTAGTALAEATSAMVLVHGRGATASDILDLARVLPHPGMAYLAPQAAQYTWYPNRFLAPLAANEPGLSSGLQAIADLVGQIQEAGIEPAHIVLGGFSQGACLASEFLARYPRRYGGLLAFSGGFIGPMGTTRTPTGTLDGMPIFMGCSDADPHIPLVRVEETAALFEAMGGTVALHIYPNMGHTIIPDEIAQAGKVLASLSS